jgi:hypothetical protein
LNNEQTNGLNELLGRVPNAPKDSW